jgi:hypothetical protein
MLLGVFGFWRSASANAARPASPAEIEGMVRAVERFVHDGDEFRMERAHVSGQWAFGTWQDFLPEFPEQPLKQNVVFQRTVGTEWRVAGYPTGVCGISYDQPIPKAVQIDLRLPSCLPSYGLINEKAFIHDSTGRFKSQPNAIKIESPSVTWYLRAVGKWDHFNLTRAARTSARATWEHQTCTPRCEAGNVVHARVEVTLTNPIKCEGKWVYGEVGWYAIAQPRESYGPFKFPCRGTTFE